MAKRTPLPCTPANCGDNYKRCGVEHTYNFYKCRCDSCAAAKAEGARRHYDKHRETILKSVFRYRMENRDVVLDYQRRYAAEKIEIGTERVRQWRLANPERSRDSKRVSGHRRRAKMKATQVVDFTREQLDQRMAYYGHACYLKIPGICTGAFDHVDHVKPIAKDGAHILANMRPACAPCNHRKYDKWPFNVAA